MTDNNEQERKKPLSLSSTLSLKKSPDSEQIRQSFSHGRSKAVTVEVKRKRLAHPAGSSGQAVTQEPEEETPPPVAVPQEPVVVDKAPPKPEVKVSTGRRLSGQELEARLRAVQEAIKSDGSDETSMGQKARELADLERRRLMEEQRRQEEDLKSSKENKVPVEEALAESPIVTVEVQPEPINIASPEAAPIVKNQPIAAPAAFAPTRKREGGEEDEDFDARKRGAVKGRVATPAPTRSKTAEPKRRSGKVSVGTLDGDDMPRMRSMAAMRRAREREYRKAHQDDLQSQKIVREVVLPETISVQDLANRMAERGADVVKSLMKLGMMVTINQIIDADTAELVVSEFGHKSKRVTESDVELSLRRETVEDVSDAKSRAPVVTIMGHVDHGKTSLLDALRQTDVAAKEAGGITQHIGAYQVTLSSGKQITFVDTPGHAAFTEMRARGANVTDVVVLVVAADDGIMEQTIEAIHHAKAANVPIIVAINKMDKPDATPERVRHELLSHDVVLEEFGGDVLSVEVSAKAKLNLDKLEEAILLQAEILDLKANPNRSAEGAVVEARVEKGRGSVATVLVQKGTLRVGDLFVAGQEFGRVRALINDHGRRIHEALPSQPVEVLGFDGTPQAGDDFTVVESETQAREIAEYRTKRARDLKMAQSARGNMDQLFSQISVGAQSNLTVVIKSDVQGSLEAISSSLAKLATSEVSVKVLHAAVGGINESDVILARASGGVVIGFNVRANPQARELAHRDGVEIRYYSIIYNVIEDVKAALSGMLAPTIRENFLGNAAIREVFNITKVGKIAGCMITEGLVKRGAKVRLLRDNVVIHEGTLKTLKRFKDEVKEAREGYECGMAFENYNDIRAGDTIECFEMEEIARSL